MNKVVIFSIITSLALFSTSFAYAEAGQGMGPGRGQGMGQGMMGHDEYMEMMRKGGGYGYGKGYGMGMYGKGGMQEYCFSYLSVIDELDLSDEQAEKIRKKKSSFRKEQIRLKAVCHGESFDIDRHSRGIAIKAVTFHLMNIQQSDEGWNLRVVLDT